MQAVHLVSCVSQKADRPCPARDLYQSVWFRKARRYVERRKTPWYILSARYLLLSPKRVIEPYDMTLVGMAPRQLEAWSAMVTYRFCDLHPHPVLVVILAGQSYRRYLVPQLKEKGHHVFVPMQSMGIGRQLQYLTRYA